MNGNTVLSLEGLCAGYGDGDVISDISFSLGRGESLCIVGLRKEHAFKGRARRV